MADKRVAPRIGAGIATAVMIVVAAIIAYKADAGDGFKPRVETIDELAGLAIGAFVVDRLLTFVYPWGARKDTAERAADLGVLRLGWGALIGAAFVSLTNLRSVEVLSQVTPVSDGWDRIVSVLAIAGGVAGLARIQSALNPRATDGNKTGTDTITTKTPEAKVLAAPAAPAVAADAGGDPPPPAPPADPDPNLLPPPSKRAYYVGIGGLIAGGLVALAAIDDKTGTELKGLTVPATKVEAAEVIIRFAPLFLAAVIVEQLIERGLAPYVPSHNKPLVTGGVSVLLSVILVKFAFDLYLLHNVGFFGTLPEDATVSDAIERSTGLERWADVFLTSLVVASGTKQLHDFADRLRKAKPKTDPVNDPG